MNNSKLFLESNKEAFILVRQDPGLLQVETKSALVNLRKAIAKLLKTNPVLRPPSENQDVVNGRKVQLVEAFGSKKTWKEWANFANLSEAILRQRVRKGMSLEEALSQPLRVVRTKDPLDRFWKNVPYRPECGCWEWVGDKYSTGYPRFYAEGVQQAAHRFIFVQVNGELPLKYQVDHLCRNILCVRLEHLEAVTQAENQRRGFSPSAINGRKIECDHGHPFTPENTYISPRGSRECRTCKKLGRKSA